MIINVLLVSLFFFEKNDFNIYNQITIGSLKLNKGESVVTCLTCYQTLTHQWIENERMKVPLEMRKYNWMAVPPPPISTTMNNIKNEPINEQNHKVCVYCFLLLYKFIQFDFFKITETHTFRSNDYSDSNANQFHFISTNQC